MSRINRRDFIKTGGVLVLGVSILPSCTSGKTDDAYYRFFTKDEGWCVLALCEQIIPADKVYGGATDAGVIFYIDRHLLGYFEENRPVYRDSLKKLQEYCHHQFGKAFQDMAPEKQVEVMKKMEKNKIDHDGWESQSDFFQLIRSHTMQGFYGSPIHGGNKDYMSFDMLRLEYPLNIGQNRYQKPLHEL